MDGHVPDEPEGDLCRYGFPPSSRHAGILPNAQREENSNRTTHTMAEPSRDGCTIVQEISLGTGGYSLQKPGPDHFGTNHSCSVDAQGSNGEKYTSDLASGKTPMELAMGRENHGDLLKYNNEKTSAEILLNMKFVPPDLVQEKMCFTGKKIRARSSKDGNLENG